MRAVCSDIAISVTNMTPAVGLGTHMAARLLIEVVEKANILTIHFSLTISVVWNEKLNINTKLAYWLIVRFEIMRKSIYFCCRRLLVQPASQVRVTPVRKFDAANLQVPQDASSNATRLVPEITMHNHRDFQDFSSLLG
jgi:hypothetical protein